MNFAVQVADTAAPEGLALVELARDGSRREWSFGEVSEQAARLAGALSERGIGRGDVVMTLIGNRPEWVLTMLACFRIGAVVLPCTEQLRAKDIALRIALAEPALIVADERNLGELGGVRVPSRSGARGRPRRGRALSDHLHERHLRRSLRRRPCPALSRRPAPSGRALARPA
jgi:acetyl-CoA synthetase